MNWRGSCTCLHDSNRARSGPKAKIKHKIRRGQIFAIYREMKKIRDKESVVRIMVYISKIVQEKCNNKTNKLSLTVNATADHLVERFRLGSIPQCSRLRFHRPFDALLGHCDSRLRERDTRLLPSDSFAFACR